ncbi:hypothetical protein NOVO_03300 [Rickettsiales bacterium Ac37b]|nr:hypothetical protein NOVO_03300 [Rickettsiales bacterium Ac37b]
MFNDNCNAKSLFYIAIDSVSKAIATDGLANLGVSLYAGIDNKRTAISIVAGTAGYIIRTIFRQCVDEEYEIDVLGVTIRPYHIGGIVGGAMKYMIKNHNIEYMTRDIALGAFNGFGCEVSSHDLKMYGIMNLTISLSSLKLIESAIREDKGEEVIKNVMAGTVAAVGFQFYMFIKNNSLPYVESFADKISEIYSEMYLLGLNISYDEYI